MLLTGLAALLTTSVYASCALLVVSVGFMLCTLRLFVDSFTRLRSVQPLASSARAALRLCHVYTHVLWWCFPAVQVWEIVAGASAGYVDVQGCAQTRLALTPPARAGPHIAWALVDFGAKAMWAGSLVSSNLSVLATQAARVRRNAAAAAALRHLRASLAAARTEAAVAAAAAAALRELAPSAAARVIVLGDNRDDLCSHNVASGAENFEAPSPPGVHNGVVIVDARDASAAASLRDIFAAQQRRFSSGKDHVTGGHATSAGALRTSGRSVVTSLDAKHGARSFSDWAVSATHRGHMCATASLGCSVFAKTGSPAADAPPLLGFLSVHGGASFNPDDATSALDSSDQSACDAAAAVLAEAARLVGAAVAALRADARHAAGVAAVLRSMGVPSPLPLHAALGASQRFSRSTLHAAAPTPPPGRRSVTFSADAARCDALEAARDGNLARLRSWDLVGDEVSAAECRELIAAMFYSLGLVQALGLSATALDAFVRSVEARMNDQPYHSWHALS